MSRMTSQAPSRAQKIPEDYLQKVKEMHEFGATGAHSDALTMKCK